MNKLEGKTALITGGTSGIGLATAKAFVSEGSYTFITGRRETELAAAVKEIGRNVTGIQGDVSNLGNLDRLFAQIKREKGRLDIVFANAGVAKFAAFGTITEELYDWTFDINVKGLLFTVQKALRSRIPTISSSESNGQYTPAWSQHGMWATRRSGPTRDSDSSRHAIPRERQH
jgi:NAD(P)-dependent dehydrogenase (short-subunit alcohol dehydrogenase family)